MFPHTSFTGPGWVGVGVAAGLFVLLAVLLAERTRTKRRMATLERSEALLLTELADARRELEHLRTCLRARRSSHRDLSEDPGAAPADPGAAIG